jgi:hypothetical protein
LGRANSQIKTAVIEAQRQRDDATEQRKNADRQRNLAEAASRTAVQAADLSAQAGSVMVNVLRPRMQFRADNDKTLRYEITEAQKPLAELDYHVNEIRALLQAADESRSQLASPWRATFDLALGRILALRARALGYNLLLAEMKFQPRRFHTPGDNTWRIIPASEEHLPPRLQKLAKQARELFERVIEEHRGTKLERLAREELSSPIAWDWEELHIDYPPSVAVPMRSQRSRTLRVPLDNVRPRETSVASDRILISDGRCAVSPRSDSGDQEDDVKLMLPPDN